MYYSNMTFTGKITSKLYFRNTNCLFVFSTESEGELHSTPSQLPQRSAELKTSRNTSAARQPVIAIRNRELYDDGADYSDYYEVKRMPGG